MLFSLSVAARLLLIGAPCIAIAAASLYSSYYLYSSYSVAASHDDDDDDNSRRRRPSPSPSNEPQPHTFWRRRRQASPPPEEEDTDRSSNVSASPDGDVINVNQAVHVAGDDDYCCWREDVREVLTLMSDLDIRSNVEEGGGRRQRQQQQQQHLPEWAVQLMNWLWDHRVEFLFLASDAIIETPSFIPTHQSLSLAAKCTVVGAACVTVAAAEALRARLVLESLKTKAGSAFAFKFCAAAAKPLQHLSSSSTKAHSVQVAAEVDGNDFPDVTNPTAGDHLPVFNVFETRAPGNEIATDDVKCDCDDDACITVPEDQVVAEADDNDFPDVTNPTVHAAGDHLPVFGVFETRAPGNEIVEASFATDNVKCDCDDGACINVPEDQVDVRSSTLQSAAINIKMRALDKLSNNTVIEGDPPAADDDHGDRNLVIDIEARSLDPGQHLDSTSDSVTRIQAACGKLPFMSDLGDEAVDVKAKAIDMAAVGDHHLDPTAGKNVDTVFDVLKAQSISATDNCGDDNANGRYWVSRIFYGIRDLVRGSINHIRSWLGKIYGGVHGCTQTADIAVCKQNLLEFPKNNAVYTQNLPALAVDLKKWVWDHRVILKKILLVVGDSVMETPSFCVHHQSRKRLVMKLYHLLRSELRC